jgi:hypothetical protein
MFLFIVNILWIFLFNTRPECYDIIKCLRNCCGLSFMLMSSTQATMNTFDECDLFDKAVQLSVIVRDNKLCLFLQNYGISFT